MMTAVNAANPPAKVYLVWKWSLYIQGKVSVVFDTALLCPMYLLIRLVKAPDPAAQPNSQHPHLIPEILDVSQPKTS